MEQFQRFEKINRKDQVVMRQVSRENSEELSEDNNEQEIFYQQACFPGLQCDQESNRINLWNVRTQIQAQLKSSTHHYIEQIQKQSDEIETEDSDSQISPSPKTVHVKTKKFNFPENNNFGQNSIAQIKQGTSQETKKEQLSEQKPKKEKRSIYLFVLSMVFLFLCQSLLVSYAMVAKAD